MPRLQNGLQRRYDLELPFPVERLVSHDAASLHAITGEALDGTVETLLIREGEDTLDVTLYLEAGTLSRAQRTLASGRLDTAGLEDVCTVLEGVSHAVCLLWHAQHGREVRALDLELQADVDKFVLLARALPAAVDRRGLLSRLFERVHITAPEGTDLHCRYRTAHRHAARYCRFLNRRFMNTGDECGLAAELARFYRLSGSGKRERIRRFH